MKTITSFYQYINQSSYAWIAAILLAIIFLQGWKFAKVGIKVTVAFLKAVLVRPTWWNLFKLGFWTLIFYALRYEIQDVILYLEQENNPAYVVNYDDQTVIEIYEAEMAKYLLPNEMEIAKRRIAEMAAKVGSSSLSIYEVMYSECGMNPFCVRKDGIAAGMLQFTKSGLTGLGCSLNDVKAACERRDVNFIMDVSEAYLVSRSKGIPLPRACDVYTCVFAPGYVGYPDSQVLYDESDGAAYTLNAGLDGFYVDTIDGKPQILQSRKMRDGKLTIDDLELAIDSKKFKLCKNRS